MVLQNNPLWITPNLSHSSHFINFTYFICSSEFRRDLESFMVLSAPILENRLAVLGKDEFSTALEMISSSCCYFDDLVPFGNQTKQNGRNSIDSSEQSLPVRIWTWIRGSKNIQLLLTQTQFAKKKRRKKLWLHIGSFLV